MIVRIWRGQIAQDQAAEYGKLMRERAIPDYRATPGNIDAWCLTKDMDDYVEFMMLTRWKDLESIQAFAGDNVERARYYDFDPNFLISMPECVEHFEVANEQ